MRAIRVELQLADGSFSSGLLRAGQSLGQFKKELERTDSNFKKLSGTTLGAVQSVGRLDVANRSLLSRMRDLSIVGGALSIAFSAITGSSNGLLGSIVKINSDMERLTFQMRSMSTAADPMREAADAVGYLREQARKMPFSLREITSTFTKLKTTGTDPMAGSLQALADGIAAFGGTDEQLHRVTLGITQMSGKSVIQMEEMRQQLGESMPSAMKIMARSMGISVRDLTSTIATGTLQAKPALDAFYGELERSFGGSAQAMMNTFSGQVSLMTANLQMMATEGGMKDFVSITLKNSLIELNDLLSSNQAKQFASNLGDAFSDIANFVANATRTVFSFRNEIMFLGKALALGMGIKIFASGMAALRLSLTLVQLSATKFTATLLPLRIAMGWLATSMRTGVAVTTAFGLAAHGARLSLVALAPLALAAAPWMLAIGAATYLAGGHFGFFKNKVKEAYDALEEFGAKSRQAAVDAIDARVLQLTDKLVGLKEQANRFWATSRPNSRAAQGARADLKAVEDEIAAINATRLDLIQKSAENEDSRNKTIHDRELQRLNEVVQTNYRKQTDAAEALQTAQMANMTELGLTKFEIDKTYTDTLLASEEESAQKKLENIRHLYATEKALQNNLEGGEGTPAWLASDALQNSMQAQIREAEAVAAAVRTLVQGPVTGDKASTEEEQAEAAVKRLDKLKDSVRDLETDATGATTEFERMNFEIARGDYGDQNSENPAVQDQLQKLREAALAKDVFDKKMKKREAIDTARDALTDMSEDLVATRDELLGVDDAYEVMQARLGRGEFGFVDIDTPELEALHAALLRAAAAQRDLDLALKNKEGVDDGIEKLKEMRSELQDSISELKGVGDGFIEMNRSIEDGDFSTVEAGGKAVEDLHDALRKAAKAKDYLDKVMESSNELGDDIAAALEDSLARIDEANALINGKELTQTDEIQNKIKRGYYEGFGEIERVRGAILAVVGTINIQGNAANMVGTAMRDNAFGSATQTAIYNTTTAVQALSGVLNGISGMTFDLGGALAMPGGAAAFGPAPVGLDGYLAKNRRAESGGNDAAKNPESSATGRYQFTAGTWAGMQKKYPELGLTENGRFDPLQQEAAMRVFTQSNAQTLGRNGMESSYANLYAMHFLGEGAGPKVLGSDGATPMSSLVGNDVMTANSFLNGMDVNGFKAFTQQKMGPGSLGMTPQMAYPQAPVSTNVPGAPYANQPNPVSIPTYNAAEINAQAQAMVDQIQRQQSEYTKALEEAAKSEAAAAALEGRAAITVTGRDLIEEAAAIKDEMAGIGDKHAEVLAKMRGGEFGEGAKETDPAVAKLIAQAKELDALQKRADTIIDGRSDAEDGLLEIAEQRLEVQRELAEEMKLIENPDYIGESKDVRDLVLAKKELLDIIRLINGENSPEYRNAEAQANGGIQDQLKLEAAQRTVKLNEEKRSRDEARMTPRQKAATEAQREIAKIDASAAIARRINGADDVAITRQSEQQKAAVRAEFNDAYNPLIGQMREWGDIQGNMAQRTAEWTSSLVGGVSEAYMGFRKLKEEGKSTGDALKESFRSTFKSIVDNMLQQFIDMMIKMAVSKMASGAGWLGQFGSFLGSAMFPGAVPVPGAPGITAAVKHTGGIVGDSRGASRTVSPGLFSGARKFHGGGIVGNTSGSGLNLKPGEVPIIAKKDEGVFTPAQMKMLGGSSSSQSVTVNAPITVNGGGGSPEQNKDLASKMSRELDATIRQSIQKEIMNQKRPGNMLSGAR